MSYGVFMKVMVRMRIALIATCILGSVFSFRGQAASGDKWVRSPNLSVRIGTNGEINGIRYNKGDTLLLHGRTTIPGCQQELVPEVGDLPGGGVEVRRTLNCEKATRKVSLTERLTPTSNSIRWTVEIRSDGPSWSEPLQTVVSYGASTPLRFWTAWSNPEQDNDEATCSWDCSRVWRDPLVAMPMRNEQWYYGAIPFTREDPGINFIPIRGDLFSIPIATILEPGKDRALSLVFSPEDQMLDVTMHTSADGEITWSRMYHRLGNDRPVTFSVDLVVHEADWRGGLRWMAARYPDYFNAPLPQAADDVAGEGAYSRYQGPLDAEYLRRIGFRTNWMASFDFPYMGMFLPPVAEDDHWTKYSESMAKGRYDPHAAVAGETTSIRELAGYAKRMREQGFRVLDYFNTTEFGAAMIFGQPATVITDPRQVWRDANDFFYTHFKNAALFNPKTDEPYRTWGDAFVVDPGAPEYQGFLLDQASRLIRDLPDSAGLCIDRGDWLRMYNFRRDDGTSWVEGYPAASLYVSWKQLMAKFDPIVHGAGKVVFFNNHDKRLDLLKGVDGIYDEMGSNGASMNLTALLTINKPALSWTANDTYLRSDPDAFFQRYLYMGVFPMAPFPGNDHALSPSAVVDQLYIDYSPLLNVMRGRKWVLTPHAVETQDNVKVNLFTVGESYVMPVMFGGSARSASVTLHGVKNGRYDVAIVHPGKPDGMTLSATAKNGQMSLTIPLIRGCAMVKLTARKD